MSVLIKAVLTLAELGAEAPRADVGPSVLAILQGCIVVDSSGLHRRVSKGSQMMYSEMSTLREAEAAIELADQLDDEPLLAISYDDMAGDAVTASAIPGQPPSPAGGRMTKRERSPA